MAQPVRIDEGLWETALAPEGVLERWMRPEQALVQVGETLAEISIEGARHLIAAPASGWLTAISPVSTVLEPGSVIGQIA